MEQHWPQRPVVVEQGPSEGPVLMVIDPTGAHSPGRLPRAWDGMAELLRVVWFDASALDDPLVDARIILERQPRTRDVYLVANQAGEQLATLLAAHRPDIVRGVFLVRQPEARSGGPEGLLGRTQRELQGFLEEHGVLATSVVPNASPADSERSAHGLKAAGVVEAVARELLALGISVSSTSADPVPSDRAVPGDRARGSSLVGQAASAAWEEVGSALLGLRNAFQRSDDGEAAGGTRRGP